ncbi:Mitochondrial amidoxime-reducing component 1 [Cytospora mali]|uniref:Mitochondrial amidoxime-reducing component 1 n=1 Tax=Cytospora mali TaxID=578113 RepID=A0A194VVG2_CYTMA|nr:Mitochondrial amidoxime-reducing component 1 [Valsa mali]
MGYMDRYLPQPSNAIGVDGPSALRLDPVSLLVLIVTLCAFCAPVFVLFPPFPPRKSDALRETHTKLGLDPSRSNLRDHWKVDHASSPAKPGIKSLFIYPVKSCKGIEVTTAKVVPTGLEFDRLFTFAQLKSPFPVAVGEHHHGAKEKEEKKKKKKEEEEEEEEKGHHVWDFITQRQFPLLATVEVELWQPDLDKMRGKTLSVRSGEAFLVLRFPWRSSGPTGVLETFAAKCLRGISAQPEKEVVLPVAPPTEGEVREKGYEYEGVRVWRDTTTALNVGSELPEELSLYLGVSNKLGLFRMNPENLREVFRCAPKKDEVGYQPVVSFQDSYPVHILSLASVRDLESKVPKDEVLRELNPRRFRANIYVTGCPAYDEDSWKRIRFVDPSRQGDDSTFHVSCRTTRCKLPNVNPDTGIRHPVEPDKSLRAFREIDAGAPKTGCLGMQCTPLFEKVEALENQLTVDMPLEVLERGEHFFKKV